MTAYVEALKDRFFRLAVQQKPERCVEALFRCEASGTDYDSLART
jgi:hypothetical protein